MDKTERRKAIINYLKENPWATKEEMDLDLHMNSRYYGTMKEFREEAGINYKAEMNEMQAEMDGRLANLVIDTLSKRRTSKKELKDKIRKNDLAIPFRRYHGNNTERLVYDVMVFFPEYRWLSENLGVNENLIGHHPADSLPRGYSNRKSTYTKG